jgi:hypothetical protein
MVQGSSLEWSSILQLLAHGRPPTVSRLVIPVSVDAVKSMFWTWFLAHVLYKYPEVTFPSLAHRNAATTIKFVRRVRFGSAAPDHAFEGHVQRVMNFRGEIFWPVGLQTSARPGQPINNVPHLRHVRVSALAPK